MKKALYHFGLALGTLASIAIVNAEKWIYRRFDIELPILADLRKRRGERLQMLLNEEHGTEIAYGYRSVDVTRENDWNI